MEIEEAIEEINDLGSDAWCVWIQYGDWEKLKNIASSPHAKRHIALYIEQLEVCEERDHDEPIEMPREQESEPEGEPWWDQEGEPLWD